jgi:hypothetical protein
MRLIEIGVKIAFALFIIFPAHAQGIFTGSGLVCDTREQIERYAAVYDGNTERTIELVNAETNSKSACGMARIAYQSAEEIADIRISDARGKVIKLTIIGIQFNGIWQTVNPYTQFTIFMLPGQEV